MRFNSPMTQTNNQSYTRLAIQLYILICLELLIGRVVLGIKFEISCYSSTNIYRNNSDLIRYIYTRM